jgi:hypothetical protein
VVGGVSQLLFEGRVVRTRLARQPGRRVEEERDDLAIDVESRVVVVVERRGCDSEAREYDRRTDVGGARPATTRPWSGSGRSVIVPLAAVRRIDAAAGLLSTSGTCWK